MSPAIDNMAGRFSSTSEAYQAGFNDGAQRTFREIKEKIERRAWEAELARNAEDLKAWVAVLDRVKTLRPPLMTPNETPVRA